MEDTTIEDVLKTVETFHNQKDYEGAIKLLKSNETTIDPGIWHYNMGTLEGKLENWPMARYHFLMAEFKGHHSTELTNNENLTNEKLDVVRFEKPATTSDFLIQGSIAASQGILTSVSLILILIGVISLWKKASFKSVTALFLSALCILGLNWWIQSWEKNVVITPQLVKDGPSVIFEAREELPVGIMLVTSRSGEWLKIIFPSRFQGWIKDNGLKEIK